MVTEKLSVDDMQCDGCAGRVRNALMKVPGVVKVITSLDDHSAEVTFDERSTTGEKLAAVLQTAGFLTQANCKTAPEGSSQKCC
ncbi:MAG TPA: heavy-metal-associated domain-containing protein [Planctomycetota bacterium]|nr:heavy-metal-associated domain-containing protein [Planctomycetota bacterium]